MVGPSELESASAREPHVIALDAQALREAAWPNPNAGLRQLAEMCNLLGVKLWIPQGALDEVRGSYERRLADVIAKVNGALAAARQIGLDASGGANGTHRLLSDWDAASERSTKELQAQVVPLTRRSVDEFFAMGVRRTPPFDDKGAGFRDAVIYMSIVDEMSRMGLSDAILVTKDKDFRGSQSPVQGQRIRMMDVDATVAELERVVETRHEAVIQAAFAFAMQLRELAREAILNAAPTIEGFLEENLEVGSGDVDGLEGWLRKTLAVRLTGVEMPMLSPGFEDVPSGQVIQASAILEITGEFEIVPFGELPLVRLKVGEDIRSASERRALDARLSQQKEAARGVVQSASFPVHMDFEIRRTTTGYADVVPTRVSTMRPSMRGILAATKSPRESTQR